MFVLGIWHAAGWYLTLAKTHTSFTLPVLCNQTGKGRSFLCASLSQLLMCVPPPPCQAQWSWHSSLGAAPRPLNSPGLIVKGFSFGEGFGLHWFIVSAKGTTSQKLVLAQQRRWRYWKSFKLLLSWKLSYCETTIWGEQHTVFSHMKLILNHIKYSVCATKLHFMPFSQWEPDFHCP